MTDVLDLRKSSEPEEAQAPEPAAEPEVPLTAELAWRAQHRLGPAARRRHYILVAVLAAAGAGVALWQASWLVLVTMIVCLATWELHERMAHPTAISIDVRGVTVNGHFYPHATLSSFQGHRLPDSTHVLSIKTDSWTMPRLVVPVGTADPFEVHETLARYVPEGEHPVSFYDRWVRRN